MSEVENNQNLKNPKISVIIPVHNTEKYLEKCLDSVLNQTFTDIEVICIDDTSSDSSLDLLRAYEQKDPRIRVFSNKINQGQGYTRNYGIKLARGKYINFMDSDDYIPNYTYDKFYNFIESTDVDQQSAFGVFRWQKAILSRFQDIGVQRLFRRNQQQ